MSMHINWSNPINWHDGLNHGLVVWFLNVPHWQGGTTWRDLTKRFDGTLTNMDPATDWVGPGGRRGGFGALDFDGSNDYVVNNSAPVTDEPLTLMCWMRPDVTNTIQKMVWVGDESDDINSGQWAIQIVGTVSAEIVRMQKSGGGGHRYAFTGIAPSTTEWTHVCGTIAAAAAESDFILYINGRVPSDHGTIDSGPSDPAVDTLAIGIAAHTTPVFPFNGLLDDVRIYNRALSAAEVSQVYQDSQVGYPRTLRRLRRRAFAAPAAVDISHVAALADSFDNVVQRRPIKVTSY